MIAVIADDFTGAAEIGGIGLRYGFRIIIETRVSSDYNADLLIVSADTRSLTPGQAAKKLEKITKQLADLRPRYIFKKLDSVMRGNIAAELLAQIRASGKKRAIIVAGNPHFGRIIENGHFSIHSVPLSKTHFSDDPDFPGTSSSVIDIIGKGRYGVVSRKHTEELPETGLIAGDVTSLEDLREWARRMDSDTVAAGGAGFFDTLLGNDYLKLPVAGNGRISPGARSLFVLGSTFPKSSDMEPRFQCAGIVRKNMPEEVYAGTETSTDSFEKWVGDVVSCLQKNLKVLVLADHHFNNGKEITQRVREKTAELVSRVMGQTSLTDLFIEGGATTSEILGKLGIWKLYPCRELDRGIIQMHVDNYPDLCITTKPGSYPWPANLIPDILETSL